MLGTIVNTGAIIAGSITGTVLKKGIQVKYQDALYNAMGFAATVLGISAVVNHLPESKFPVLFIVSLAIGSLIGYMLNLEERFHNLINRYSKSNLGQGLSTGILLFCIGTLSMLGPVMSATYGDNTYLFTNATLDLVTSMVLASTYGIGIILSAPVLFLWQGSIYLIARYLSASFFSKDLMCELSIVGGVLILMSGLAILKIKDAKTLNVLPSLFIPIIFFLIRMVF